LGIYRYLKLMKILRKIGLGGSCHWCTEAIFISLVGVQQVEQGWLATKEEPTNFSEAVVIHYDDALIGIDVLIEIHLHTHSSTSDHAMREKYRSAVYYYSESDKKKVRSIIGELQDQFDKQLITQVLPVGIFELNEEKYLDYYRKDPSKPFCKNYIAPKLKILLARYSQYTDHISM